jgi:hypothetical protein
VIADIARDDRHLAADLLEPPRELGAAAIDGRFVVAGRFDAGEGFDGGDLPGELRLTPGQQAIQIECHRCIL